MTRDRSPSRRTARTDLYATPHPDRPLPSIGAAVVLAALPVVAVAVLSFPVAAATVAATAALVGAAVRRRYPSAAARALPTPAGDATAAGNG